MSARGRRWRMWRWPIVVAAVSLAGLLSALLGDDWWDAVSWFALGLPLALCLWFGLRRRPVDRGD